MSKDNQYAPVDPNQALDSIRRLYESKTRYDIKAKGRMVEDLIIDIFSRTKEKKELRNQTRRLERFYLPIIVKNVDRYVSLVNDRREIAASSDMADALNELLSTAVRGLRTIRRDLYEEDVTDSEVDADVLEMLMKSDGVIDDALSLENPENADENDEIDEQKDDDSEVSENETDNNDENADDPVFKIASVVFPGSDKTYDYLYDGMKLDAGDRVIVETQRGEKVVIVSKVSETPKSKLELPFEKYRHVTGRAVNAPENAETFQYEEEPGREGSEDDSLTGQYDDLNRIAPGETVTANAEYGRVKIMIKEAVVPKGGSSDYAKEEYEGMKVILLRCEVKNVDFKTYRKSDKGITGEYLQESGILTVLDHEGFSCEYYLRYSGPDGKYIVNKATKPGRKERVSYPFLVPLEETDIKVILDNRCEMTLHLNEQ